MDRLAAAKMKATTTVTLLIIFLIAVGCSSAELNLIEQEFKQEFDEFDVDLDQEGFLRHLRQSTQDRTQALARLTVEDLIDELESHERHFDGLVDAYFDEHYDVHDLKIEAFNDKLGKCKVDKRCKFWHWRCKYWRRQRRKELRLKEQERQEEVRQVRRSRQERLRVQQELRLRVQLQLLQEEEGQEEEEEEEEEEERQVKLLQQKQERLQLQQKLQKLQKFQQKQEKQRREKMKERREEQIENAVDSMQLNLNSFKSIRLRSKKSMKSMIESMRLNSMIESMNSMIELIESMKSKEHLSGCKRQMGDIWIAVGLLTAFTFFMVLTFRVFRNLGKQRKSGRKSHAFPIDDLGGVTNLPG